MSAAVMVMALLSASTAQRGGLERIECWGELAFFGAASPVEQPPSTGQAACARQVMLPDRVTWARWQLIDGTMSACFRVGEQGGAVMPVDAVAISFGAATWGQRDVVEFEYLDHCVFAPGYPAADSPLLDLLKRDFEVNPVTPRMVPMLAVAPTVLRSPAEPSAVDSSWQVVSILAGGKRVCAGTLVDFEGGAAVLTAAHCVFSLTRGRLGAARPVGVEGVGTPTEARVSRRFAQCARRGLAYDECVRNGAEDVAYLPLARGVYGRLWKTCPTDGLDRDVAAVAPSTVRGRVPGRPLVAWFSLTTTPPGKPWTADAGRWTVVPGDSGGPLVMRHSFPLVDCVRLILLGTETSASGVVALLQPVARPPPLERLIFR